MTVHGSDTRPSGWTWPQWGTADKPNTGAWLWPAFFLGYLIEPVIEVLTGPFTPLTRAGVITVVLFHTATYIGTLTHGQRLGKVGRILGVASLMLPPVLLSLLMAENKLVFWTYGVATALVMLPRNAGIIVGLSAATVVILSSLATSGQPDLDDALLLVALTLGMYGFIRLGHTVRELRASQEKVAHLAVAEERSRLARDLHDVLGHSLTTITIKAALARRILESDTNPQRAIQEIKDVEHLSRQTMTEVRATVSANRETSLPAEIAGAKAALDAANITPNLPTAVDDVHPTLREPFAYVLREGVTNVIRHSNATRCEVRIAPTYIEIRDNGTTTPAPPGNGLTGLTERLTPLGGTLTATQTPTGFLLRATAPLP